MINPMHFGNAIFVHYDKYNTSKNNWTPTGYATHLPSGDKIASKRVNIYSLKSRKDYIPEKAGRILQKGLQIPLILLGSSKKICHELR